MLAVEKITTAEGLGSTRVGSTWLESPGLESPELGSARERSAA